MYAVVVSEPPNLQEITDKINEIVDFLNGMVVFVKDMPKVIPADKEEA